MWFHDYILTAIDSFFQTNMSFNLISTKTSFFYLPSNLTYPNLIAQPKEKNSHLFEKKTTDGF